MAPSTPKPAAYSPPAHLVEAAQEALHKVPEEQFERARALYEAYCAVTDGKSAVTGASLPPFAACPVLVRACWLAASRV